ncbi:MAG TPA: cysteine desulfurase family protein [Candidatus Paceibacterota bacterium]|nr:cysteine desulfurase family protein [Candidatus Paceibacterota bacterium]
MNTSRRIYFDYASATPVIPEAARAVAEAQNLIGNPSSIHAEGVAAAAMLTKAREGIVRHLGCKARELVFISGGTEANSLAILGFARATIIHGRALNAESLKGTHWIVSAIEHPSVLECFAEVERLGGSVSFADPDKCGIIHPETIERLLRPETIFVSIGWANSEIGIIQPLARIARVFRAHEKKYGTTVIFHSDAGQAPLYEAAHVHTLAVDLLTLDSGKMYGPRGIGALYLSDRVVLAPLILGGKQERGLRAGTENIALAAGFAAAFEVMAKERDVESARVRDLRDKLSAEIFARIPGAIVNGDLRHSLPHVLNISLPRINSEYVILALDHAGIAASTKSACREGEEQRSHVVEELGGDAFRSRNTLRFSLGRETKPADISRCIETLVTIVQSDASRS